MKNNCLYESQDNETALDAMKNFASLNWEESRIPVKIKFIGNDSNNSYSFKVSDGNKTYICQLTDKWQYTWHWEIYIA